MKCPKCNTENKDEARHCKKCGQQLKVIPVWKPTWKWHVKTLGIILVVLVVIFFVLNAIFKPYMRDIPKDVTPWLKDVREAHKK